MLVPGAEDKRDQIAFRRCKRRNERRHFIQPSLEHLVLCTAGDDGVHGTGAVPGALHADGVRAVPADGVDASSCVGCFDVTTDGGEGFAVDVLFGIDFDVGDVPPADGRMAAGDVFGVGVGCAAVVKPFCASVKAVFGRDLGPEHGPFVHEGDEVLVESLCLCGRRRVGEDRRLAFRNSRHTVFLFTGRKRAEGREKA